MLESVGPLQPEVIFGDIADQIPLRQADRGVGFDVAFDVFFELVLLAGECDADLGIAVASCNPSWLSAADSGNRVR